MYTAGIAGLRKSLRAMHPSLQFVISMYDPATMLNTSAAVRQEAIARIIAAVKEVSSLIYDEETLNEKLASGSIAGKTCH